MKSFRSEMNIKKVEIRHVKKNNFQFNETEEISTQKDRIFHIWLFKKLSLSLRTAH